MSVERAPPALTLLWRKAARMNVVSGRLEGRLQCTLDARNGGLQLER